MNGTCGKIPVLNGGLGRRRATSRYILGRRNFLLVYTKEKYFRRLQLRDGIMLRRKSIWFTWGKHLNFCEWNLQRNEHGGLGIDRTSFPGVAVYYSGHIPRIFPTFVS